MLTDDEFNLLQDIVEGRSKGKPQKHDSALNGMISCGECGYCITVEQHTKKYKNGNTQTFSYYRCTKKNKKNKCSQPYIATKKLEEAYANDLTELELDTQFAEFALEALEEVKEKDKSVNKNSQEALQKSLESVTKRINNLVSLKISPDNSDGSLLSDEEFGDRKRALLIEKEKIAKKLTKVDKDENEWAEIAKESFNFGLLASKRFKKGNTEDKKVIFKTIGSNPTLKDKKLQYKAKYLFFKYKEGVKKTYDEIDRLEPANVLSDQSFLEDYIKSSLWCPGEDLNLHAFRHTHLKRTCIPFHHPGSSLVLYHHPLSQNTSKICYDQTTV